MTKRYLFWRGLVRKAMHPMVTEWAQPFDGRPAVFCPNHAGALGPIDMCAFFPLADTCHPWFNQGMATPREVPAYVRQDYWWRPGCFFEPLYNMTLPYLAAAIVPPILNSVPGVPVYHDARVIKTFRRSIDYLRQGEHLIIFPQQPAGYQAHEMELNRGFLQICPMVYKVLGVALRFYPVHIDHANHRFIVDKPVEYDPARPLKDQEDAIMAEISAGL